MRWIGRTILSLIYLTRIAAYLPWLLFLAWRARLTWRETYATIRVGLAYGLGGIWK